MMMMRGLGVIVKGIVRSLKVVELERGVKTKIQGSRTREDIEVRDEVV